MDGRDDRVEVFQRCSQRYGTFRGNNIHSCLDGISGLLVDFFLGSLVECLGIANIPRQRDLMAYLFNDHP